MNNYKSHPLYELEVFCEGKMVQLIIIKCMIEKKKNFTF